MDRINCTCTRETDDSKGCVALSAQSWAPCPVASEAPTLRCTISDWWNVSNNICCLHATGRPSSTSSNCPIRDPRVEVMEGRTGPPTNQEALTTLRYGTYGCGANLLPTVWTRHTLQFEVDCGPERTGAFSPQHRGQAPYYHPGRTPQRVLDQHPVDVLVVDHSDVTDLNALYGVDGRGKLDWHDWLGHCRPTSLPRIIVQVWPSWAIWRDPGPTSKHARKPLERMGYDLRYRILKGHDLGGPVAQERLVIVCFLRISPDEALDESPQTSVRLENWEIMPPQMGHRPMSNCLRPTGAGRTRDSLPPGTDLHAVPVPHAIRDPMPPQAGRWIETDAGYRRLHSDELAVGLGVPKTWATDLRSVPRAHFQHLVGVHLWEGVTHCLDSIWDLVGLGATGESAATEPEVVRDPHDGRGGPCFSSGEGTWEWTPADLRLNGGWYRNRLRALKRAAKTYPVADQARIIDNGKADLARHRENYGPQGPQQLQILWWEFPREHWEALRTGSSMNFLKEPRIGLTPNARMTPEQQEISGEFVDELIALKVLTKAPDDDPILANCPLFVVPKPGQPGQWRIIADCKKGGQNEVIGQGPVYLPQAHIILHQMYSGGWTAVVDASKFFYQFPTVLSERKYLGLVHPVTGEHYRYAGLPMGTGSSPALAGQYGAGFLRRLRARHPEIFDGEPIENTWRRHVAEHQYDDRLGHGRVLISKDGLPAVLTFGFVDDFALHGPTYAKTARALTLFMDFAVEVGMLCNPAKVALPSQRSKYCGFIFDTRQVPTLRVPAGKRSRARAMVDYLLLQRGSPVPRLSLVVVTGILESQVPATPARLGHTYLRRLYDAMWVATAHDATALSPKDRYYCMVDLTPGAWEDLGWWARHLVTDFGRPAHPRRTGTLVAHFGDGSGTGTGGTAQEVGGPHQGIDLRPLDMWMGKWDEQVHSFSSNWRELKTLELTLQREKERGDGRARDTTLFYFTDNIVTYFVVNGGTAKNPRLQALIYRIKALEQELQCVLEVVHIPGTTIIAQGSDDLSRGVWLSSHRDYVPAPILIPQLFAGVALKDSWQAFLQREVPGFPTGRLEFRPWSSSLDGSTLFGRCTVWAPPVEMAPTILSAVITAWTEQPLSTSVVVLLPRILQRQWQRLTRHMTALPPRVEEGSPHKRDCYHFTDSSLPVYHRLPLVVLYLAPHTYTLPDDRLEPTPPSLPWRRRQWYERQKELLYGLPVPPEDEG